MTTRDLVARHAEELVAEALTDTRVVLINGARQAGKSTLTRLATSGMTGTVIPLLDDPATLRAATDDPTSFVDHDGLLVIDEIQLVPDLLRPIKVAVDLDPTPGRFLLAGSSRILALRTLPDALPGRIEIIELWPFSQGEIAGTPRPVRGHALRARSAHRSLLGIAPPRLSRTDRGRRVPRGSAADHPAAHRVLRFLSVHPD